MDADPADGVPGAGSPTLTQPPDRDHAHQDGMPFTERFPSGLAGAPISNEGPGVSGFRAQHGPDPGMENIWSPFRSQRDWDFAQWAKNRGPTLTAVTELLAINGVCSQLILKPNYWLIRK